MNGPSPLLNKVTDYVSSEEAMRLLGVRVQTLYSYVSRGLVQSVRLTGQRQHLYRREDIERLKARSLARSGHGVTAASAMHWGEPIIPTSITEITPQGPCYRGHLATELVQSGTSFESVAELLWTGIRHDEPLEWVVNAPTPHMRKFTGAMVAPRTNDQLLEMFAMSVLHLGIQRGSAAERLRGGRTLNAAREMIHTITGCFGYVSPHRSFQMMSPRQSIVVGLMRALAVETTDENREALEALLILLADHELSPGAFAARVAASAGATLHSCIAAAICTSSGVQTGRLYDKVESFLVGCASCKALIGRADKYQQRGIAVPGFGHPLYSNGDPRAKMLLAIARRRSQQSRQLEAIYGFIEHMQENLGQHPRQELATMTLIIAIGLPNHCASALFCLSRLVGWVAHVQEQRLSGLLLRPRAKFVG